MPYGKDEAVIAVNALQPFEASPFDADERSFSIPSNRTLQLIA